MRIKPFIPSSVRRLSVKDSPEDGMPRAMWDVNESPVGRKPPSYACTVTAFDGVATRDAHLADLVAQRDNATIHSADAPPRGGPFVTLSVHLDRPVEPGALYDDVVTVNYDGRGRMSGKIQAGIDGWQNGMAAYSPDPFEFIRPVDDGFEVANTVGCIDLWMEADLVDRLKATMSRHGLGFADGGYVSKVLPGSAADALNAFRKTFREFEMEFERIVLLVAARQRGRIVREDAGTMRILKRMAAGCPAYWSEEGKMTSYQLRPGDMFPYEVSGEAIRVLYSLGLVETLWDTAEGGRFPSAVWHLVKISETGRRFLEGDFIDGLSAPLTPSEMPNPIKRRKPMPFVERLATYAGTIPQVDRERLHGGMELPKSFDIAKRSGAIGAQNALSMVLIGMLSGVADVTEDGRFKLRKA